MYPEIISEVKQLIGDDIILWGSSLFCKKEKNGKETPWHQDGEYWPIKPLESVTVWLSIDEVTEENGPLQYIPGSHLDRKLASFLSKWDPGIYCKGPFSSVTSSIDNQTVTDSKGLIGQYSPS